jgi:hypothetical protein
MARAALVSRSVRCSDSTPAAAAMAVDIGAEVYGGVTLLQPLQLWMVLWRGRPWKAGVYGGVTLPRRPPPMTGPWLDPD